MAIDTTVHLFSTRGMVKEPIPGGMETPTRVNSSKISVKERVFSLLQTAMCTKENSSMGYSKVQENTLLVLGSTKGVGKVASTTVLVFCNSMMDLPIVAPL